MDPGKDWYSPKEYRSSQTNTGRGNEMNLIHIIAGVFLANMLTILVVKGYLNYEANQAQKEVAAYLQQSAKSLEANTARMRAEAERAKAEALAKAAWAENEKQRRAEEAEQRRLADAQEAQRKDAAWKRFHVPRAGCINPTNFEVTKECINEEMRKRREFEDRWKEGAIR